MSNNYDFNNISVISWRSVVLVGETAVPGENHRIEYTSPSGGFELVTDCTGSCKFS